MSIGKITYVQRGTIKPHDDRKDSQKLSAAVSFDYMGSAEFEYGALPTSLRWIENNAGAFNPVLCIETIRDIDDKPLYVFTPHNKEWPCDGKDFKEKYLSYGEFWQQYLPQLQNLAAGNYKEFLKENTRFSIQERKLTDYQKTPIERRTNFWWDIRNHTMWSFNKNFMTEKLFRHLQNSWMEMSIKRKEYAANKE